MINISESIMNYLHVNQVCPECGKIYPLSLEKLRKHKRPVKCPNAKCNVKFQILPLAFQKESKKRVLFDEELNELYLSFLKLSAKLNQAGYTLSFAQPQDINQSFTP